VLFVDIIHARLGLRLGPHSSLRVAVVRLIPHCSRPRSRIAHAAPGHFSIQESQSHRRCLAIASGVAALVDTLPLFAMDPTEPNSTTAPAEASSLKRRRTFPKPKPDGKKSQVESSPVEPAFIGPLTFATGQQRDADAATDSDPEDDQILAQDLGITSRGPTIEEDREALLKDLGQPSWENAEAFRAAHEERVQRCSLADERDQNRNILHWLAMKLLKNSITRKNLDWLVEMVVTYDPNIITCITGDIERANCLHLAFQHKQVNLVESLCKNGNSDALREAISQGNHYQETCLHLATKLSPPPLNLMMQLLAKADPKVIAKQRSCRILEDEREDLNTFLHDFVHIDQCFRKGYMQVLRLLIRMCPEAMRVQNSAKETPFQFHIATRDEKYPDWNGVEFDQNLLNGHHGGAVDKPKTAAAKVGQHLLNESFSQSNYEDACLCLYGESKLALCEPNPYLL
jgi:hypothetical protein